MSTVALAPSARLVHRLAARFERRRPPAGAEGPTRRSFLARAALVGTALATNPISFLLRPGSAYAQTTGCGDGNGCGSGWTVFCVTVAGNRGKNTCPSGSFAAGWWKADNSAFCQGRARYYIDCNRLPSQPGACSCVSCYSQPGSCDQRRYCCNSFRYGQCNTQIAGVTPVVCRVISCTPPWEWGNCTTTSRTDNRTGAHTAPELAPAGSSSITIKYQDLGLLGSVLGARSGGEYDIAGGRQGDFANGSIVSSAATGARSILPAIRQTWVANGGSGGWIGFPTSDTVSAAGGLRNEFAGGNGLTITSHPQAGSRIVYGGIRSKWRERGGVLGVLAYPVAPIEDAAGGGLQQRFQGGTVAYRSDVGVFAVQGSINVRWTALSATNGVLAYPVTDELAIGDGRGVVSWFQGGGIWHTGTTGAHDVRGGILHSWYQRGGPGGAVGYPTGDHTLFGSGGSFANFERGTLVGYPNAGTFAVLTEINTRYVALGGPTGEMGRPLTEQLAVGDNRGRVSWFEAGGIFFTSTTGARDVRHRILHRWYELGGPGGSLGYPSGNSEAFGVGGVRNRFERGTISWDPISGYQVS